MRVYRGQLRLCCGVSMRNLNSQHRTPIIPQIHVNDPKPLARVQVGYLLQRNQIVKCTLHPLEIEMSFLLEHEHTRYSRHEESESATHFMASRGQSIDILNRNDPNQIKANFFGLELYQDAMKAVLQRYSPEKRVTAADLWDPATCDAAAPPPRHTLYRKLDDYLYLIVQESSTGKWTVPNTERQSNESLRMTADRAVSSDHGDGLTCYFWSNAPQATLRIEEEEDSHLFIFSGTYLTGRPRFQDMNPPIRDHAWVSRHELLQYNGDFKSPTMLQVLLDITADSNFDAN
ncbi:unnamed protein product [Phytomonas sp. Hart1]|nr:unnamed protein product [Phytomonas sp. Hart1]|eukprot:CCW71250.1 unnamed protein product [Phytomonas sp. isolate Hart1]